MTYAFTHMGNFLLLLAIEIWVFRWRFRPEGWDSGLEAGIWASRLGFEGGGTEKKEEEEEEKKKKEKEKIPHMCESIGHRPLRGRCPKSR